MGEGRSGGVLEQDQVTRGVDTGGGELDINQETY